VISFNVDHSLTLTIVTSWKDEVGAVDRARTVITFV
jgi:hypothetical protein